MYDKSLEQLIDAVIADGIITEQERKVVYKKAASLGIDQDEIEVYLDGRLHKFLNSSKPKSGKYGTIRTCPNCGASISSFETKCHECGYVFVNTEAVNSMTQFFKKVNSTSDNEKKCELIKTFPIPNDRESLLEFLAVSAPNAKKATGPFNKGLGRWVMIICGIIVILSFVYILFGYDLDSIILFGLPAALIYAVIAYMVGENNSVAQAWNIKTEVALNKINITSLNDTTISSQAKSIISDYKKAKKKRAIIYSVEIIFTTLVVYLAFFTGSSMKEVRDLVASNQYTEAEYCIEKVIQRTYSYSEQYDKLIEYMTLCVSHMCDNGEYEKARQFIVKQKGKLRRFHAIEDEEITILRLEGIIDEYQISAIETSGSQE